MFLIIRKALCEFLFTDVISKMGQPLNDTDISKSASMIQNINSYDSVSSDISSILTITARNI